MYTLIPNTHFLRRAKKLYRKNPGIQGKVEKTLNALKQHPFSIGLGTHSVTARCDGKPAKSSIVTKDLRIIWRFRDDIIECIALIDLGGHSGSKKIYK